MCADSKKHKINVTKLRLNFLLTATKLKTQCSNTCSFLQVSIQGVSSLESNENKNRAGCVCIAQHKMTRVLVMAVIVLLPGHPKILSDLYSLS